MASTNPFDQPAPGDENREPTPDQPPATTDRHEDVVARVKELLGKYPTLGSRQLFDLAVRMHPDLQERGFRSFHARYVLPLKREQARAEGRLPKPRAEKAAKRARRSRTTPHRAEPTARADTPQVRARVRDVLLRLARQVAVAESRADLVDALARVEEMVDEVLQALQPQTTEPGQTEAQ